MPVTYAVLFKTHFWDAFAARQLERLKTSAPGGDVYVVVDETLKPAPAIPHPDVIGVTNGKLRDLGLSPTTTHGSVIWYNIDYPHYVAHAALPDYDFYVAVEYDAVATVDFDAMVARMAREGTDYAGFPLRTPAAAWPWQAMHRDLYGPDMLVYLSCISVFSQAAMRALLARRQAMGAAFAAGTLKFWPNNEAFIPNEIRAAGLTTASLAQYGRIDQYDWWPPVEEKALADISEPAFVHPVLHGTRFIRSLAHHEPSLASFFKPRSPMRQKLRHHDQAVVRAILRDEARRRLVERFGGLLVRLGLRREWFAGAKAGAAQRPVTKTTAHNAA